MRLRGRWATSRKYGQKGRTRGGRRGDRDRVSMGGEKGLGMRRSLTVGKGKILGMGGGTYVDRTNDTVYLSQGFQVWAETAVHAKDLFIDNGSDGEAVEGVGESFPQFYIIPSLALVVEAIDTTDGRTFMVTS